MDKHIDRVRKLLAIADSASNPNEAGTAYANAMKLMAEHAISMEQVRVAAARQLGQDVKPEPVISRFVWTAKGRNSPTWVNILARALCDVHGCSYVWTTNNNGATAVCMTWGRVSDLELVEELLRTIPGQIDALCERSPHKGRTAKNNFRLGAAQVVAARLREAASEARKALEAGAVKEMGEVATCTALALRNLDNRGSLALAARNAMVKVRTTYTRSQHDKSAYESGRAAGAQVNTSRGRALT